METRPVRPCRSAQGWLWLFFPGQAVVHCSPPLATPPHQPNPNPPFAPRPPRPRVPVQGGSAARAGPRPAGGLARPVRGEERGAAAGAEGPALPAGGPGRHAHGLAPKRRGEMGQAGHGVLGGVGARADHLPTLKPGGAWHEQPQQQDAAAALELVQGCLQGAFSLVTDHQCWLWLPLLIRDVISKPKILPRVRIDHDGHGCYEPPCRGARARVSRGRHPAGTMHDELHACIACRTVELQYIGRNFTSFPMFLRLQLC